jgi:hypothetical protein
MQHTALSSKKLILSLQRRLATLRRLERTLKARQAVLRKAYTESLKAHRTRMGTMIPSAPTDLSWENTTVGLNPNRKPIHRQPQGLGGVPLEEVL